VALTHDGQIQSITGNRAKKDSADREFGAGIQRFSPNACIAWVIPLKYTRKWFVNTRRFWRKLTDSRIILLGGGTHMSEGIVYVTDDAFEEEVLKADGPVLVDYWAEWCGPCKMIGPVLEEIAKEYSGKIKIAKLNIDENPATPPKYGIRGIPTLMLFKNGNVEATKVGAVSKSQLSAFIDENL
jgi:thioredoxin 1